MVVVRRQLASLRLDAGRRKSNPQGAGARINILAPGPFLLRDAGGGGDVAAGRGLDARGAPILAFLLQDRLKAMVASVAYEGRAVPAAMWTRRQTRWPTGQGEMTATMLEWARNGAGGAET